MANSIGSLIVKVEADLGNLKRDMAEAGQVTRDMGKYTSESSFKVSEAGKKAAKSAKEIAQARRAEATMTRLLTRELTTSIGVSDRLSQTISNAAKSFRAFGKGATAAQKAMAMLSIKTAVIIAGMQGWKKAFEVMGEVISDRMWRGIEISLGNVKSGLDTLGYSYDRVMMQMNRASRFTNEQIKANRGAADAFDAMTDAQMRLEVEQARSQALAQGRSVAEADAMATRAEMYQRQRKEIQNLLREQEDLERALPEASERHEMAAEHMAAAAQKAAEATEALSDAQSKRSGLKVSAKQLEKIESTIKAAQTEADRALAAATKAEADLKQAEQDVIISQIEYDQVRRKVLAAEATHEAERLRQRSNAAEKELEKAKEIARIQQGGVGLALGAQSAESWKARRESRAASEMPKLVEAILGQRAQSAFDDDDKRTFKEIRDYLRALVNQEAINI